jgi:hypothetical protein
MTAVGVLGEPLKATYRDAIAVFKGEGMPFAGEDGWPEDPGVTREGLALSAWLVGTAVAGSLFWGATAWGSTCCLLLCVGFAILGARQRFLPAPGKLLWAAVGLGAWLATGALVLASPVPRAGLFGWLLGPIVFLAFKGLASLVERAPESAEFALALSVVVVSGSALVLWGMGWGPRPALPLGHHNLLAFWLVLTLPLAAAGLAFSGQRRGWGGFALGIGGWALASTRSLAGAVGFAAAVAWAWPRLSRALQRLLLGAALLLLATFGGRLRDLLMGEDPSFQARIGYLEAALSGAKERVLWGWGLGSTPWLLAEWMTPRPGWNPPAEGVGEAHSLAAQLLFELGLPLGGGVFLAGLLLPWWLERRASGLEESLRLRIRFAGAGLFGSWCALAASAAPTAVFALPAAWLGVAAVAWGLSRGARKPPLHPPLPAARHLFWLLPTLGLLPMEFGQWAFDRARRAEEESSRQSALEWACRFDPAFPLYRAHRARWAQDLDKRVRDSWAAADLARGVGFLWLQAASEAWAAGQRPQAEEAARRALALDRLNPLAAWVLFRVSGGQELDCAARAVALDPRLAAAAAWQEFPPSLRAQMWDKLKSWPGLPPDYAVEVHRRLSQARANAEWVDLVATVDETPATSLSLHLFRRSPWPQPLLRVRLVASEVASLSGLGSAATRGVAPAAFPPDRCRPEESAVPARELNPSR